MFPSLRILAITALYPPYHLGGYELRCRDVLERLRARGHQVRIVTSSYGVGCRRVEGHVARVLHLAPSRNPWERLRWDVHDLRFLKQQIGTYRPHVVHLWHTAKLARAIFPFLAQLSVPVVYDEGGIGLTLAWRNHGGWFAFCEGKGRTRLPGLSTRILCRLVSAAAGGVLPWEWQWPQRMFACFNSVTGLERVVGAGVPLASARVIYSGIDLGSFTYRERDALGAHIAFVVPGRVHRVKGIHDAVEAVAQVPDLLPKHSVSLKVVGPIVDAAYHNSVLRKCAELGMTEKILFTGAVNYEQMASIYHEVDVCLFLSHQVEGLSRVPLEAMACGALVLTTGCEGSREIMRDGETGFVVPVASPHTVAASVKRLVEDQSLYRSIVERARHEVEERFNLERVVDQIEEVLFEAANATESVLPTGRGVA
jgi:glycogen(starch) synthase